MFAYAYAHTMCTGRMCCRMRCSRAYLMVERDIYNGVNSDRASVYPTE